MAAEGPVVDAESVVSITEKQMVPRGGVLLVFQHKGEPPVFPDDGRPSFLDIDDAAWESFEREMKVVLAKMWSNKLILPFAFLIPVLIAVVILEMLFGIFPEDEQARRLQSSSSGSSSDSSVRRRRQSINASGGESKKGKSDLFGAVVGVISAVMSIGIFGGFCFVTGKNAKWDKSAKAACAALAEATGLCVEYRRILKIEAWRAVAIFPKDGAATREEEEPPFGLQTVRVKLPAKEAVAGRCLSVEAPDGATKTVRVPKRLSAENSFLVSMPRLKAREAVTVAVAVPEGSGPGSFVEVSAPDGRKVHAAVPPDHVPGQTFMVAVPADSPQAELLGQPVAI